MAAIIYFNCEKRWLGRHYVFKRKMLRAKFSTFLPAFMKIHKTVLQKSAFLWMLSHYRQKEAFPPICSEKNIAVGTNTRFPIIKLRSYQIEPLQMVYLLWFVGLSAVIFPFIYNGVGIVVFGWFGLFWMKKMIK